MSEIQTFFSQKLNFLFLISGQSSPYLTQYILRHLLNNKNNQNQQRQRQSPILDPSQLDRKAIEEAIYGGDKTRLIFPETKEKIKHYLDEAKELTDVIDFHQRQPLKSDQIE